MATRVWIISEALQSYRRLLEIIDDMTEQEVYKALSLECDSRRRSSLIDRLIAKAADFNRQHFVAQLKEKLHGSYQKRHPHPR